MTSNDWHALIAALPQRIYLTVDMDVFDSSEVPAVGNPEPGGVSWDTVFDFLCHLFAVKTIVAADIVELRPSTNDAASIRLAARLAGLMAGLSFGNFH